MIAFATPRQAQESRTLTKPEAQETVQEVAAATKESKPGMESIEGDTVQQATAKQSKPTEVPTCESAIRQVWPKHLQEGAILVSINENRMQDPTAVGAVNDDGLGSRDYGCFQINDYWHPSYFTDGDWQDPVWAAKYALHIYEGRQSTTGNGWTAWYAVQGILW